MDDDVTRARETTFQGVIHRHAILRSDRIAVEFPGGEYSYSELDILVRRLLAGLRAIGLRRGDRLVVLSENRVEYALLLLAAAEGGIATAAVNWRNPAERTRRLMERVDPAAIAYSSRFEDQLADLLPSGSSATIVALDASEDHRELGDLLDNEPAAPADDVRASDIVTIMYTSGSTGDPKGVAISHGAMVARAQVIRTELAVDDDDVFIGWAPMFHISSTDYLFTTLILGGRYVVRERFDAQILADDLERHSVGWLMLMPGLDIELIEALGDRRIRGVKAVGAMADLVPPDRLRALTDRLDAPYVNSFGSTEAGLVPGADPVRPTAETPIVDLAKRPTGLCQVRVVDKAGRDVDPGDVGELLLRSPTMFSGYWADDETTARSFAGGWFHTGDLVRMREDRRLTWVDRAAYMLKSGGENVYPAVIERVLLDHPDVLEAVVVGRPDPRLGVVPIGFVATSSAISGDELLEYARQRLARYEVPADIVLLPEPDFPRGITGKILRRELEDRARG